MKLQSDYKKVFHSVFKGKNNPELKVLKVMRMIA